MIKKFIVNTGCKLPSLSITIITLALMLACRLGAQSFTPLYSFTATGEDGESPYGGLILAGNVLYGTTVSGGTSNAGTVFAVHTGGAGFTNLHSFVGSDGAYPEAGLVLSNNTLYGTARSGGNSANGTVFAVNTDGTGFKVLHSFSTVSNAFPFGNYDGELPIGGLLLSGHTLYGTARQGGTSGQGTVFAIDTDGTGFSNLHSFSMTYNNASLRAGTNSDGIHPTAGLILSGSTLYGTASDGGYFGNGTVFAVNTDGTGFTNLHSFSPINAYTNSDGQTPSATLILRGGTLYGTTVNGGVSSWGTVFALNTNGTDFTNLHSFSRITANTNLDGANPQAELILSGNTLYGTTFLGGDAGHGTVFAVDTDSTGFTTLYSFAGGSWGYASSSGLSLSGNTLYGTLSYGGDSGNGMVFSLSVVPQLTINRSATNVILTWATKYVGFDYSGYRLQSAGDLSGKWGTNLAVPVVIDGQYTVTNPISGTQQFFRLSQ